MRTRSVFSGSRIVLVLLVFATLATAILLRPAKWLSDFDQSFYLTIAYDIVHHGVFSNGIFDKVDSTREAPPPGRFFGPVYPALVVAAMKIDPRFARAVDCSVEANHKARDGAECEVYALPMHLIHAALLAVGVLAIALAAEMIFAGTITFWLAGGLATLALLADADLFSFVMTESLTFSLYSLAALSLILGLEDTAVLESPGGGMPVRAACPDTRLVRRFGVGRAGAVRDLLPMGRQRGMAADRAAPGGIRNRLDGGGQPMARPQCGVDRTLGADGRIRIRNADRALRIQRHDGTRIPACLPVLLA